MSEKEVGDTEFGVQVSIGFVGEVATAAVGLVGSIVLARALGPGGYGLFTLALAIGNFFENPVNGWALACKKRLTETEFDEGEAMGSVLLVALALAVLGAPIAFGLISVVSDNPLLPLAVPVLFVPLATYWSLRTVLSGRQNFSLSTWSKVVETFLQVALQVTLVALGFEVWGMVFGAALAALLTIPVVYRWVDITPVMPSRETLTSVADYARWSIPQGFVGSGLSKIDIVLLGWLASAAAAGDYRVALALSMPAVFVSGVLSPGLMGRISNLESRAESWRPDLYNAVSFSSVLAIPIFFGSLALGDSLIVTVYSSQYAGAGAFLIGLALYQLLSTQTEPRTSVILGLDRPDVDFRISVAEFALNVVLGVGLWFAYGPVGIVVATVLTQTFAYVTRLYVVTMLTDLRLVLTRPLAEQIAAGALMGTVVWLGRQSLPLNQWYAVVALVGLGGLVYGGVLLVVSSTLRTTARGILTDFLDAYDFA